MTPFWRRDLAAKFTCLLIAILIWLILHQMTEQGQIIDFFHKSP
jgi:hypothetical protein